MKKKSIAFIFAVLVVGTLVYFNLPENDYQKEGMEEYKGEKGRPDLKLFPEPKPFDPASLKGKELEDYKKWRANLDATQNKFTNDNSKDSNRKIEYFSELPSYSYANNRINGSWSQKYVHMTSNVNPGYNEGGSDALGSVYDPVNEEIFILSRPGHIYKIDESKQIKWSLRNHKRNFLGNSNLSFRGFVLNGINLPDNSFRLVHQQSNGGMEYSDDEGRTWTTANGALFQNSLNFKTHVVKTPTGRRVVAHGANFEGTTGFDKLFISDDYGLNYRESRFKFSRRDFQVNTMKPHNDNSVYAFVRRLRDSKIFIFKLNSGESEFALIKQPAQTLPGLNSVIGTLVEGKFHFYVSAGDTKPMRSIYYSSDEGEAWELTNDNINDRNLYDVHPTKPNIVYRGFTDFFMSDDFGATFTANGHRLSPTTYIWDLEHSRTYDKEDGGNFTFVGTHFGSYYTSDPSDWSSWKSVNRGSPNILAYDAITSEVNGKIYTANQDRGSQSFPETPSSNGYYPADREANTDIFRVAFSKNESSVWFWYWYGRIGRASTTNGGNYGTVVGGNFYGSWWATSMVPSPKAWEDAIYIPSGETQLDRILYTGSRLVKGSHPYVFPGPVNSFNYSSINTNRWYVGLKNGDFFYSTDGGITFTETSYTGPMPDQVDRHTKRRQVIVTSPVDENTVYYAGVGNIFLISKDGGITFTDHSRGFSGGNFMDFTVSPDGKFIFAACHFGGAWVYSTEEDRWYRMNGDDVPEQLSFTDAQYIKSKDIVRFATYGSGVLDFKINKNPLSVNDNLLDNLGTVKAYPNPTQNQFEIALSTSKKEVLVHIYSITGKLVSNKKHKVVNGKIQLNIENESTGVYMTKVFLEKPVMVKVVKK